MPNYAEMSLEELDARGRELRGELVGLREAERNDETNQRMAALVAEVNDFDLHYTIARHQAMAEMAKREQEQLLANLAPAGATAGHAGQRALTIGERIMNAPEMQEWIEHGMQGGRGVVGASFGLPGYLVDGRYPVDGGVRALTEFGAGGPGNAATGNVNALLPVGQPIAPVPRQARLAMRDLIPSTPTTLATVPYVRELSPTASELGASAVAEGNVKPDAGVSFQGETADPTVVAVSVSPSKQLWQDAQLVVAYINQRLPYLVRFKEDAEILNGSGNWPDIQGLKNVPGKQTQAAMAGEYAQTIGMGIANIENADGTATGVVLNPIDAWTMFTKRAAGGSGTFDAGTPFSVDMVSSLTVWGLPTVRSRVYAQGSALVGDYAHGAMILDREGVNTQVYPQHSDYAIRNQILVLCEERLGLAVWRPDLFCDCALA